ncbi:MAG: YeeE/YedE family protein [Bacteroidia bacterium]|nr:YeeE/YedE family protein [Bacteroidia bacterium]
MKYLKYIGVGLIFGVVMSKAEIISWYRIYEMFHFQSFHMYGIIGSAVLLGIILTQAMKAAEMKTIEGETVNIPPKDSFKYKYWLGGIIFGLGWALSGACPGPMYVLVGYGHLSILVVILGALLGTFSYGVLRKYLPH